MIKQKSGFSLIELLVVIGIIAVLAAMLMPLLTSAKNIAKKSVCQSNLAQVGKAFEAYLSDYSGCYPNIDDPYLWQGRHWRWPMRKYIGFNAKYDEKNSDGLAQITGNKNNILGCPLDPTPTATYDKTSYVYSASFYHTPEQINSITSKNQLIKEPTPPCATIMSANVRFPSKKVIVSEWLTYHSSNQVSLWAWGGERNFLFADGHVKYISSAKIHRAQDGYPDINVTIDGIAGRDID